MDMTQISEDTITTALLSAPGFAIGAKPALVIGSPLHRHLMDVGYVGQSGGLTRKGSIKTEKLKNEQLERLFPL